MGCLRNPTHVHEWPMPGPKEVLLIINVCERTCDYCNDGKEFNQCSHLRAHVKTKHVRDFPNGLKVANGIMGNKGT